MSSAYRPKARVESVDLLRGIVMILMALDHVRDYFGGASVNATDLATTTVPLFFTRWVTHFCAPVFFLLTGTGAYLAARRRGVDGLPRFLATRGVWLIILDTVIMRCFVMQFNFDFRVTILIVLWALGWSMIALSVLVRWRPAVAGAFGLVLIFGHNLFDGVRASNLGGFGPLWMLLHQPGLLYTDGSHFLIVSYPIIPWIGVTAIGYWLGTVFDWDAIRRRSFLLRAGASAVALFVILRFLNVYGDPQPWTTQSTAVLTMLSFLNLTKYPPSLLFLLMTLGPALLFLRAVDARTPAALRFALEYGRVPLFYYILHFFVIHLLAVMIMAFRYGAVHWAFESPTPDKFPFTPPPDWQLPLPWIYVIWIGVVAALWPVCRWFAGVKARRRDWWLSYL